MGDKENCFEAREERKASCSLGRGDMKANEKGCKSLRKPRTGYSAGCCGRLSDEKSAQLSPAEISAKLSSLETEGLLLISSLQERWWRRLLSSWNQKGWEWGSCWMLLSESKVTWIFLFSSSFATWKKLNCDDKDLAIEPKPWTLYEITAQVLNSNLVSLCWEREIIAT